MGTMTWADLRSMMSNNTAVVAAADEIAMALKAGAAISTGEMPEVCEGGEMCRAAILETSRGSIAVEWEVTLMSIAWQLESTVLTATHIMNNAWELAKACDPECPCDDIMKEYREILNLQEEITNEITELEIALNLLKDEQYNILTDCPDYAAVTVEAAGWTYGYTETTETVETTVI